MDKSLPNSTALEEDFALAHPQDYLDGLNVVTPQVMREACLPAVMWLGFGWITPLPL
jgi:hypothetical protein